MKNKKISKRLLSIGLATLAYSSSAQAERVEKILWSGTEHASLTYGLLTPNCAQSTTCFQAQPTKWNSPLIRFPDRFDISHFEKIEFLVRASLPSTIVTFKVMSWPYTSVDLDLSAYVEAGSMNGEFQKVSIPVSALSKSPDGSTVDLTRIYTFAFGRYLGATPYEYTIENIVGVTGTDTPVVEPTPSSTPPPAPLPPESAHGVDQATIDAYIHARNTQRTAFGCELGDLQCQGATTPSVCEASAAEWPQNQMSNSAKPLAFLTWAGPYQNRAGYDAVQKVNQAYASQTAAGLKSEKFRSFDAQITITGSTAVYKAHSTIPPQAYPQVEVLNAVPDMERSCQIIWNATNNAYQQVCEARKLDEAGFCQYIFDDQLNYGVRSLGVGSVNFGSSLLNLLDSQQKARIRGFYLNTLVDPVVTPPSYSTNLLIRNLKEGGMSKELIRKFYENNYLHVTPAIRSFSYGDTFAFLSPLTLFSQGASGTDSMLLKPVLQTSAALPPTLKKRIMDQHLLVPTLMYLFKSQSTANYLSPEAHPVAYALPAEAAKDTLTTDYANAPQTPAPFIEGLIRRAQALSHIPPVARLKILDAKVLYSGTRQYFREPYFENNIYEFTAALRQGETLELIVDLSDSWTDQGLPITRFDSVKLRGQGQILPLTSDGSLVKIVIPYMAKTEFKDLRTDILININDGTYDSAPAYISIRHIQSFEEKYYFQ
jgi:hypothetical protein